MTDSQALLLVVALIYLTECATWTNLHCIALMSWWGVRWRWTRPGRWFGNRSGGLLPRYPFPPLGTCFQCQLWPVSLAPTGILSNVSHAVDLPWRPDHDTQFVAFDQIERVALADKQVTVNGRYFCRTTSAAASQPLLKLIRSLRELPSTERSAAIELALADRFDTAAIIQRESLFLQRQTLLRILVNSLFGFVFLAIPLAVWLVDWIHCWPYVLAGLVLHVLVTIVVFRNAHRALYPEQSGERRMQIAVMLLNPLAAIRAHDVLARDLFAPWHPLAVAQVLCDGTEFRRLARLLLLDLRQPMLPVAAADDVAGAEAESWFRARNLAAVEQFLSRVDVVVDELLAAEPPLDETCRSYCPRCHCQYVIPQGRCAACGGIALVPWSDSE